MNHDRPEFPISENEMSMDVEQHLDSKTPSAVLPHLKASAEPAWHRPQSPTPPRSLFRSTTGKGVALATLKSHNTC